MKQQKGFVLVNALVLVAALAGVAAVLLARAETGRAQISASSEAAQLEAYLDAFEVLAINIVNADPISVDHSGEAWAKATYNVPLDRGAVAGGLVDLQARFNVNLLTNAGDEDARAALDYLLVDLGVAPQVGDTIVAALAPGGPSRPIEMNGIESAFPGGTLHLIEQLPLPARDRDKLAPYLVALPGAAKVNVNTASPRVLAAFLPGVSQAKLAGLVQTRARQPFTSLEGFTEQLIELIGSDAAEALVAQDRFSIGTDWFAADMQAQLGTRQAHRYLVIRRYPLPAGALVAYRLDRW